MIKPYDYSQRKGVKEITWSQFGKLAAVLVERLSDEKIEVVVGIARAGLFPATAVACALRCEMFPVRVTRRLNDQVVARHPTWKVDVSNEVDGKRVAVIDEISDSGETLAMVVQRIQRKGALRVVSASLVSHSWANPRPDYVALVSDALVVFPCDRNVYQDGEWQVHPELAGALVQQERQPGKKREAR